MTLASFYAIISCFNGMSFSASQGKFYILLQGGLNWSSESSSMLLFDSAIKTTEVGLSFVEKPAFPFSFRVIHASERQWT